MFLPHQPSLMEVHFNIGNECSIAFQLQQQRPLLRSHSASDSVCRFCYEALNLLLFEWRTHTQTHAHTHAHTCTHTHTLTHIHTRTYSLTHIHTRTRTHTHAHTYSLTHTHTHTHTHYWGLHFLWGDIYIIIDCLLSLSTYVFNYWSRLKVPSFKFLKYTFWNYMIIKIELSI